MQKEKKLDCPLEIWLSAKICLPDNKRGFALAKLVDLPGGQLGLFLTLDPVFVADSAEEKKLDLVDWNDKLSFAHGNLTSLPKGSAVLLAPPKIFGSKFWIARLADKFSQGSAAEAYVTYSLSDLKRLRNFLEARGTARVPFRTPVYLVNPNNYVVTEFFSNDISPQGLSLIVERGATPEDDPFVVNNNYLMQLKIHEGLTLPTLNYRCVHMRQDILTGAKLVGFELNDKKAKDHEVEYNLTLLTWSDKSEGADSDDDSSDKDF